MAHRKKTAPIPIRSYRDLIVWRKAMELVTAVYDLTSAFPDEERNGLAAQMRHTVIAIPATIAEGRTRASKDEYRQLLNRAASTAGRLETYVMVAQELQTTKDLESASVQALLADITQMLSAMA